MKYMVTGCILVAAVLGLGFSGETLDEPTEEMIARRTQALADEMASKIENPMRVIGVRTWNDTTIEFLAMPNGAASNPFNDTSEVLISRRGAMSDGDIVAKLYAASDVLLSPAEIYLALSEKEELPTELAQHHLRWTREVITTPRTSDFLRFNAAEVERTTDKFITPGQFAATMNPPIPAHHYINVRNDVASDVTDGANRATCLEVNSNNALPHFVFGQCLTNFCCPTGHYATGWVRHGIANTRVQGGAAPPAAVIQCGGWLTGDPTWYCTGPSVLGSDQYWIVDGTAAQSKVASYTFSYANGGALATGMRMGSAKIVPN